MARRRLLALTLGLALASSAWAQEPPPPAKEPGFLGVSMQPWAVPGADPPQALVAVTGVVPGSAAEKAGLQEGDVIVSVDGASIAAHPNEVLQKFGTVVREHGAGEKLILVVRRRTYTAQVYLDEQPQGAPADANGTRGATRVVPDLAKLLDEHPGRLVSVRARVDEREGERTVVLGTRQPASTEPLPQNASLRPDLEAMALEPGAALAARLVDRTSHTTDVAAPDGTTSKQTVGMSERLAAVRARLEQDELVLDAFRLTTVRYLHRDPLRLPAATRELSAALQAVHGREGRQATGPQGLLDVARTSIDAVGAVDTLVPPRPPEPASLASRAPGEVLEEHARFMEACFDLARVRLEKAFERLTADERRSLQETLPSIADAFAGALYLHEDQDRERWARHQVALRVLERVDRVALLAALEALTPLAEPAYLAALEGDLARVEAAGVGAVGYDGIGGKVLLLRDGTHGRIVFGASGVNHYRPDSAGVEPVVIVDVGGDDVYHVRAAGAFGDRPLAVCLDLDGDDRYQATAPFAQAGALLGAALLVDQAGDDAYTSNMYLSQGAALCGAALLLDQAGDDVYRAPAYAQGAALCQGLAALLDGAGNDRHTVGLYGQGFAGPGAFGALVTRGGDDRYEALGRDACTYGDAGTYHAMSQGASVGFRHFASGGVAALVDDGGRDRYEAGNFSQGGGYYFGWGMLSDLGDEGDVYEGSRYSAGFAAHSALGSFLDRGGDDRYRGWVGAQASAAWDLAVTAFLEDGGDDRYETGPGFSIGASAHNGVSLFVDRAGRDTYKVGPGRAGPNDYHGGHSVSVFVDAGGQEDDYQGGGAANGTATIGGDASIVVDLPGALEDVTDEVLRALLAR